MAKILSIKPYHEILIDDSFILIQDDDFIAVEIPNGFNWLTHSKSCPDCKAFMDCFIKVNYQWLLKINQKYYLLDLNEFGKLDDHFSNTLMFGTSSDFHGTKLKLKMSEADPNKLNEILNVEASIENYENCAILRDTISFLKNK